MRKRRAGEIITFGLATGEPPERRAFVASTSELGTICLIGTGLFLFGLAVSAIFDER